MLTQQNLPTRLLFSSVFIAFFTIFAGCGIPIDGLTQPPPKLECSAVESGQSLNVSSRIDESNDKKLIIEVYEGHHRAQWEDKPTISDVQGITLNGVELLSLSAELTFTIQEGFTSAGFTLEGKVKDDNTSCTIKKTFSITADGDKNVTVN